MAEQRKGIVKQFAQEQMQYAPQAFLDDLFENYYSRRREIYFMNLVRGIFFGFGSVIGGTIVVALLLWLLSALHFVPFLDGIINSVQESLNNR
ncbi:MAG TPA: DUF5665 domain-containing protein [Magnetospirillaceae bacterium]|nr:DUF5665 domain-containing protein [Magnetospirillaceae bacterium]